ncbi:MAG: polymer-forming cytoskeletal protein [Myxococcota bacterium]
MEKADPVVVGSGIRIKGKVRGAEDVILKGQIEGTITLPENHLMIESSALMAGDVSVENVTIRGEHAGNTRATECVQLDAGARVLGDVQAPRLVVADGAKFKGNVDMVVDLPAELGLKFRN